MGHRTARLYPVLVVAAAVAMVLGCNLGWAAVSHRSSATLSELPGAQPLPNTSAGCQRAVIAVAGMSGDAWGYGLYDGVSANTLVARYGPQSREVRAFRAAQVQLLGSFRAHGYRGGAEQLDGVRPTIRAYCATGAR